MDQKQIEILDLLYKSILSPESWGNIMDRITDDLGSYSVHMLLVDKVITELQDCWMSNALIKNFPAYIEQGLHLQEMPMIETLHLTTQGEKLTHIDEIERSHNLLSDRKINLAKVNAWILEQDGIKDRFLSSLNNSPNLFDHLCISFKEADTVTIESSISRAKTYLPHLSNLISVSRPFLLLKARFNAVLEVLDKFKLGVLLLTSKGEVIDQNRAATNIVKHKDGFSIDLSHRVQLLDSIAKLEFSKSLSEVTSTNSLHTLASSKRIVIPRKSGKPGYLTEISPLRHHDLPLGALMIVADPEETSIVDTTHFTEMFNLTNAEQNVCQLLSEGKSSRDIADIRNTSIETSRSQIKSVLTKTQTFKQTELVRLALSVNIPMERSTQKNKPIN